MAVFVALVTTAWMAFSGTAGAARDINVTIEAPAVVMDNTTFTVNATAYNAGTGAGNPVEVQFYIDGNATGPAHSVGNLGDGENGSATQNFTLPCGAYMLNVTADPTDGVPETNESNNNATHTLLVMPFANFSYSMMGQPGAITLDLDASSSHGCAPLNYTWDIGGLARYGVQVTFAPPAGDLTVTLTARSTANSLLVGTLTRVIPIPNAAPSLVISLPDDTISTLTPLRLSVEADDPDGGVASYLIDFGDGNSSAVFANASSYEYLASGTFTVTVRVTDNLGATNESSVSVTVANQAPRIVTDTDPREVPVGTVLEFNATGSSDPEGGALTYTWNFGDGQTATGPLVNHTFSQPGTYPVTLTVTDERGANRTSTIQVKVDPKPSAGIDLPIIGGIIGLMLALLLLLLLLRRRRKDDEPKEPGGEKAGDKVVDEKAGEAKPAEGSSSRPPSP